VEGSGGRESNGVDNWSSISLMRNMKWTGKRGRKEGVSTSEGPFSFHGRGKIF